MLRQSSPLIIIQMGWPNFPWTGPIYCSTASLCSLETLDSVLQGQTNVRWRGRWRRNIWSKISCCNPGSQLPIISLWRRGEERLWCHERDGAGRPQTRLETGAVRPVTTAQPDRHCRLHLQSPPVTSSHRARGLTLISGLEGLVLSINQTDSDRVNPRAAHNLGILLSSHSFMEISGG